MTVRSAFLLCTIWAAFGSASAELVDIAWAVDGRFASQTAETGTRRVPLPAASPATRARRAVGVDHHVADLTGEAVGATNQRGRFEAACSVGGNRFLG